MMVIAMNFLLKFIQEATITGFHTSPTFIIELISIHGITHFQMMVILNIVILEWIILPIHGF